MGFILGGSRAHLRSTKVILQKHSHEGRANDDRYSPALDRQEWHWNVTQCIHLNVGCIKVKLCSSVKIVTCDEQRYWLATVAAVDYVAGDEA